MKFANKITDQNYCLKRSVKTDDQSLVATLRKIITEFTRLISLTRIGKPVLMTYVVSKDKNSRWLIERTSLLDEIESKTMHKDEEGD